MKPLELQIDLKICQDLFSWWLEVIYEIKQDFEFFDTITLTGFSWDLMLKFFGHSVIVTGPLKVMPPISKPLLLGSPPIPPLLLPYLFGHISQKVHNLFAPSYRNANPRSATDCEIFRGPPPFRTFQFFVSQILNFARGQWLDDSSIMEISSKQFLSAKHRRHRQQRS